MHLYYMYPCRLYGKYYIKRLQIRNLLRHRMVKKKLGSDPINEEEFFLLLVKSYILTAAKMHFGMDSLESDPNNAAKFEELELSKRIEKFMLETELLLNHLVSFDFEWPPSKEQSLPNCDHKFQHSKEVVSLGLFYMEFVDAVREADGEGAGSMCW